jgi:hypothetical protein
VARIYIPSCLGDVRLEATDDPNLSQLIIEDLTPGEEERVRVFLKGYNRQDARLECQCLHIPITEGIGKAHKRFIKAFKADKPVIHAVKVADGKLEIVEDFEKLEGIGVTTEKPPRGCPLPSLVEREKRAERVLREFLSAKQWQDFTRFLAFVCTGNRTGNKYLVVSRWNPLCSKIGLLSRLDGGERYCRSLESVPPAEEMLAVKICVENLESSFIEGGMTSPAPRW